MHVFNLLFHLNRQGTTSRTIGTEQSKYGRAHAADGRVEAVQLARHLPNTHGRCVHADRDARVYCMYSTDLQEDENWISDAVNVATALCHAEQHLGPEAWLLNC